MSSHSAFMYVAFLPFSSLSNVHATWLFALTDVDCADEVDELILSKFAAGRSNCRRSATAKRIRALRNAVGSIGPEDEEPEA